MPHNYNWPHSLVFGFSSIPQIAVTLGIGVGVCAVVDTMLSVTSLTLAVRAGVYPLNSIFN